VGTVIPFFTDTGFDPEAITAMADAYERAWDVLRDRGQPDIVREVIARRIIKAAKDGERDPDRLCGYALRAFGGA
jgi:hypothetical protein